MNSRARLAWMVAVAGLVLIGLVQGVPNRHAIEDNLTYRSASALEAAGLGGIQVSFLGRDGTLGVPRKADLERAQSIVAGVEGVRVVSAYVLPSQTIVVTISGGDISADGPIPNDLLLIAQALSGPGSAVIELRDGRITLSGRVTPFAQEAAVSAAGDLVGESNVVDQLELLPPPPPLGGPEGLQRELNQLPPITFDNNKATLTVAGQASVVKAAELLHRMPLGKVRIEGHTDTTGSAEANLVLSQARARTVLNALVSLGINAGRLIAIGRGEAQPKVPDTSPENRAINRRVEFVAEPPPR